MEEVEETNVGVRAESVVKLLLQARLDHRMRMSVGPFLLRCNKAR
jgi:hypothetical protein